jgi:hypothetical protein
MLFRADHACAGTESLVKTRPRCKHTLPDREVRPLPDPPEVRAFEPIPCAPVERQPLGAAEDDLLPILVTQRKRFAVERRKSDNAPSDRSDTRIAKLEEQGGQPTRLWDGVIVEVGHDICSRRLRTQIPRARDALPGFDQVPRAPLLCNLTSGFVPARVVDDDHRGGGHDLLSQGGEAALEKSGALARRDHDRSRRGRCRVADFHIRMRAAQVRATLALLLAKEP